MPGKSSGKKTDEDYIAECEDFLHDFESKLNDALPIPVDSDKGKIEYLSVAFRELLARRISELGRGALDLYKSKQLIPGAVLTRAIIETAAVMFYGFKKMNNTHSKDDFGNTWDILHRIVWGGKIEGKVVDPIQVLTAIKHLDKEYKVVRSEYDFLCELAHPNGLGVGLSYAKYAGTERDALFSNQAELGISSKNLPMGPFGLGSLAIILLIAIHVYDDCCEFAPEFVERLKAV